MRKESMGSRFDQTPNAPINYASPQLIVYGRLNDLTAAGSQTPSESNGAKCTSMSNQFHVCMS